MTVARLEARLRRLEQRTPPARPWERWAGVPVLDWPEEVAEAYVLADGAKHLSGADLDALIARGLARLDLSGFDFADAPELRDEIADVLRARPDVAAACRWPGGVPA